MKSETCIGDSSRRNDHGPKKVWAEMTRNRRVLIFFTKADTCKHDYAYIFSS